MSNARVLRLIPPAVLRPRTELHWQSNVALLFVVALVGLALGSALRFEFEVVAPAVGAAAGGIEPSACGHDGLRTHMCEVASQGGFVAVLNY